jgi:hypothetical protein
MTNHSPTLVDKRKHSRFKVNDDMVFAVCPSKHCIVGQIIDVSKSGVSFKYAVDQTLPETLTEVGILLSGAGFIVKKNPFQSVSDTEIIGHPTSTIKMRRHSGHFLNPAPPELEEFIEHHATWQV